MIKRIFDGVKVADFSWVAAGPQVGRELAEHGATVIRIESHRRPDVIRLTPPFKDGIPGIDRSGFYAAYNVNKLGISLDLNHQKGRAIARKLALWADIVSDSMVPGTMKKWGLDYESLSIEKPDLIYFSTNQQGQSGPHARFAGYGALAAAIGGFSQLTGLPDHEPLPLVNQYTDIVAPWYLIIAVVGALRYRRKTGRGVNIDQAQIEAGLNFIGPALLDYSVNGRIANRDGNRDPYQAPHGIYPCRGKDRWVAIAVATEEQWSAFCKAIGSPAWTAEQRFSTLEDRKAHEDELDRHIAEWTSDQDAEAVMTSLQAVGVPAGVTQTAEDLFKDPQLAHRHHFQWLEHPVIGWHAYHSPAYRMSETPARLTSPAPCLGQHNQYVLQEILGLTEDEMADLLIEGVITTENDLPMTTE